MISDEHLHAPRLRGRDAIDARDTVVDGDEQIGPLLRGHCDDLGREAVTVFEAIRYDVTHVARAEQTQRTRRDRAAGRTIGVEIGDDEHAFLRMHRRDEQLHCLIHTFQRCMRQYTVERAFEFARAAQASREIYAAQYRMLLIRLFMRCVGDRAPHDDLLHELFSISLSRGIRTDRSLFAIFYSPLERNENQSIAPTPSCLSGLHRTIHATPPPPPTP